MARSRNIKPGLFTNEHLAELPFETRLLFAGLPCFADRDGRLEDRPKRIKMAMFPADNLDIDSMLAELEQAGFIERYAVDNSKYIQIVNFLKHQKPHVKETASTIPSNDLGSGEHLPRRLPAALVTSSLITDSLKEQDATRKRVASKQGTRLPDNWKPDEGLMAWAMNEKPGMDIQRTLDSFTDYWRAKPGAGGRKIDWNATFRNWVRNENTTANSNRTGKQAIRSERPNLSQRAHAAADWALKHGDF